MKMCPNSAEPCGDAAVTVSAVVPLLAPLVAVTVTVPTAIPVATPPDPTVATAVLLEDQPTAPSIGVPFASRSVAVSCTVAATATAAGFGVTVTEATAVESGPAPPAASPPQPAAPRTRISRPAADLHGCRDRNERWKVKSMRWTTLGGQPTQCGHANQRRPEAQESQSSRRRGPESLPSARRYGLGRSTLPTAQHPQPMRNAAPPTGVT